MSKTNSLHYDLGYEEAMEYAVKWLSEHFTDARSGIVDDFVRAMQEKLPPKHDE